MPRPSAGTGSSLIQSTSFLESIPVTLTMEPKDWISTGLEDEGGAVAVPPSALERRGSPRSAPLRGFDVVLRRKPGEGFGFVIASQDVKNSTGESPEAPRPRNLLQHLWPVVDKMAAVARRQRMSHGGRLLLEAVRCC